MENELTFDFLCLRGFIPTCNVGANVIYNKWGLELDIHCNFVYCYARVSDKERKYICTKKQLIELEKLVKIDEAPIITNMSVSQLKELLPDGYIYILNKRKKRGMYQIKKGEIVISEGHNDEAEDYYLRRSLLYILKYEKLLPNNSIHLKAHGNIQ